MSLDAHGMLAALAVDLLTGADRDLARGAERARDRRLAGLFLHGLQTRDLPAGSLAPDIRERLERAARAEEIQDAIAAREAEAVLSLLSNLDPPPLVLKGRLLAHQVWPRPWHRPSTDLDLLVERESLAASVAALVAAGYRRPSSVPLGGTSSVLLQCPPGGITAVDLHWQPFRSVGHGIDASRLLARARPTTLEGHRVRALDDPDRLLHLLVHAATHGLRRIKWLLDLYGTALRSDAATWRETTQRAAACRATRPFFAAASVVADLDGAPVDAAALRSIRPRWPVRQALFRLVSLDAAVREARPSLAESCAFEIFLEERPSVLLRRAIETGRRMARGRVALDRPGEWA